MNFGEVLGKAWKIIWKYKILWIFGILGGCGGYNSSSGNLLSNRFPRNEINIPANGQALYEGLVRFFEQIPFWVYVLLFLFGVVLSIVLVVLNTIGQIGLIKGAMEADEGATSLPFGSLFNTSLKYFWRVFLLGLLVAIVSFIIAIIAVISITVSVALTLGLVLICLIPLICLLIPLSWAISLILEQSTIAIIVEDKGIIEGLSRGWKVVTSNIGTMIVMALILYLGGGVVTFLLSLPVFGILVPLFLSLALGTGEAIRTGGLVSLLLLVLYTPILLVASGILRSYISSAWTLTFRRLTGKGLEAPIIPSYPEAMPPSTSVTP